MIASSSNPILIPRNKSVWDPVNPIYAVHALVTNSVPVQVWFPNQREPIVFPPGAFVGGAIYPYYVVKLDWMEPVENNADLAASFVGLRLSNITQ